MIRLDFLGRRNAQGNGNSRANTNFRKRYAEEIVTSIIVLSRYELEVRERNLDFDC
jgi:hypothetical protein